MKKYLIIGLLTSAVFSVGAVLAAKPDFQAAQAINPVTGESKNTVAIPSTAVEVAPNIYYLGAVSDNGRLVEGYAFIHYKKGFARPSGSGGKTSPCYGFLSKGAKWKAVEPYIVNAFNTDGLDHDFVKANLAANIGKWETAAGKDILGNMVEGVVDGADFSSMDNKNEVYFADIDSPGAIGITVVWGVFYGPVWQRVLLEWDQVYDDFDFDWSATGESDKMDFENIATHELGHSVGLADLYETSCLEQTMYGYANDGETKKRSLESGDIAGVKELYK